MSGKSHIKVAIGVSLISFNPSFIVGAIIGSLLPDIDTKYSIFGRYNVLNRLGPIKKKIQHRGVTHSWMSLLGVAILSMLVFDNCSAFGVILGYTTHLLCDAATWRGIQFMYPEKKIYRFAKMKTGGFGEWVVSSLILLLGILLLVGSFSNV